jgi:hypothetical protein
MGEVLMKSNYLSNFDGGNFVKKMKKIVISLLLITFILVLGCQASSADDYGVVKSIDIKKSIYLFIEPTSGYYNPGYSQGYGPVYYPPYFDMIGTYHVRSAAEITNKSDTPVKNLIVKCIFTDEFGKDLAETQKTIALEPGETKRLIFYSGITPSGAGGIDYDDINKVFYMTPEDEKEFLDYGKDVQFGMHDYVPAVMNMETQKITCKFELNYKDIRIGIQDDSRR